MRQQQVAEWARSVHLPSVRSAAGLGERALVLPAHLGGQGAAEIERNGSRFAIKQWAGFARIA